MPASERDTIGGTCSIPSTERRFQPRIDHPNPFVAYGPRMAWWAFARAHGMTEAAVVALAVEVADGFGVDAVRRTARWRSAPTAPTPVWVKDETGNVGGSHKSRHLVGILLHLRAAAALRLLPPGERPPLAIASCGNAAIAAATLARQAEWPLHVYVPDWASPIVLETLEGLGASITVCERREADPPGDPAVLRFREAVEAGALPFSVQGPENGMCLDGGRTIGWEIADAVGADGGPGAARPGGRPGGRRSVGDVRRMGARPERPPRHRAGAGMCPAGAGVVAVEGPRRAGRRDPAPLGAVDDALGSTTVARRRDPRRRDVRLARRLRRDAPQRRRTARGARGGDRQRRHDRGRARGSRSSATGAAGVAGLLVREGRPADGEQVAVIFSGVVR